MGKHECPTTYLVSEAVLLFQKMALLASRAYASSVGALCCLAILVLGQRAFQGSRFAGYPIRAARL